MPKQRTWSEQEDEYILQAMHARVTYDVMAAHLNVCRNAVIERRKRLKATRRILLVPIRVSTEDDSYDLRRGPLPSGHPVSWGALTYGTMLDGVPFDPER